MLNVDCFVRTAPVTMDVNYGRLPRVTYLTYVPRGAEASVQSGIYRMPHTVICCLLFVNAYLSSNELCRRSINFARSCVSHESKLISQIASYCIHFARCKSPMGSNILFCADRYQTNIDNILNGSTNHVVYSHYNRSITDVQLRASSFLSEILSIRDSRQSFFGSVAFTKAELAEIINHICTN